MNHTDSGCDADSFVDAGCDQLTSSVGECMLSNGRKTWHCCDSVFPCAVGEGNCKSDEGCASDLVCGTNNCGSPFKSWFDCCESVESIAASECQKALSDGVAVAVEDGSGSVEADHDAKAMVVLRVIVIGVVVVCVVVLLVLFMVKRRKRVGMKDEIELCRVVQIVDGSPLKETDEAKGSTVDEETAAVQDED